MYNQLPDDLGRNDRLQEQLCIFLSDENNNYYCLHCLEKYLHTHNRKRNYFEDTCSVDRKYTSICKEKDPFA